MEVASLILTSEEYEQVLDAFTLQSERLSAEMDALVEHLIRESGLETKLEIELEKDRISREDRDYLSRQQYLHSESELKQKIEQINIPGMGTLSKDDFFVLQRIVLGAIGTLSLQAPILERKLTDLQLQVEVSKADVVYIFVK